MVKESSSTKGRRGSYMGLTPLQVIDKSPAYMREIASLSAWSMLTPEGNSHTHTYIKYIFMKNKPL